MNDAAAAGVVRPFVQMLPTATTGSVRRLAGCEGLSQRDADACWRDATPAAGQAASLAAYHAPPSRQRGSEPAAHRRWRNPWLSARPGAARGVPAAPAVET